MGADVGQGRQELAWTLMQAHVALEEAAPGFAFRRKVLSSNAKIYYGPASGAWPGKQRHDRGFGAIPHVFATTIRQHGRIGRIGRGRDTIFVVVCE